VPTSRDRIGFHLRRVNASAHYNGRVASAFAAVLFVLGAQWSGGLGLTCLPTWRGGGARRTRRRRVRARLVRRGARSVARGALPLGALGAGLLLLEPTEVRWLRLLGLALCGAPATLGAGLLLVASRLERRGRSRRARLLARPAGFCAAGGGLTLFAGVSLYGPWLPAAALLCGVVGLVAGLAGKPRPSGQLAALGQLAACAALALAVRG